MKLERTNHDEDFLLEHYRAGAYTLEVRAFAMGQYRIQMWWDGPKGMEYRYPDGVPPNF